MDLSKAKVLVFDSGVGGLGVVSSLHEQAPELGVSYLADSAFFPYGEKEDSLLLKRIVSLISSVSEHLRPDIIVLACNTASTLALSALREKLPNIPIVGCVPPIKMAADNSTSKVIGLLATKGTGRRPYLKKLLEEYAQGYTLLTHVGKTFADLAEKYMAGLEVNNSEVQEELQQLFSQKHGNEIDAIALGCTHYSFLMPFFSKLYPNIKWCDPQPAVARQTIRILKDLPDHEQEAGPKHLFFATKIDDRFPTENLANFLVNLGFDSFREFPEWVVKY